MTYITLSQSSISFTKICYLKMANYFYMNISELTHQRLAISIKSLNQDPSLSPTLKGAFKAFHDCLNDQKMMMDIFQSELVDKASSSQLHYAVSQKLSVNEFLKYFQKVQKIVESIHVHSEKEEEKMEGVVNDKIMRIAKHLEVLLEQAKSEQEELIIRKIQREEESMEKLKRQIQQVKRNIQKLSLEKEQNKENKMREANSVVLADRKCKQLLEEVKIIQEYCEENKYYVDQLISQNNKIGTEKLVTFNDLRTIISNLQANINQSIQTLTFPNYKTFWQSYENITVFNQKESSKNDNPDINLKEDKIRIDGSGIYHIVCGFFPKCKTQINLWLNGEQIFTYTCVDLPRYGICRTLMAYIKISGGSQLTLQCRSQNLIKTQGFISLTKF